MINMKNIVIKKAILCLLNDNENSSDSDVNKSERDVSEKGVTVTVTLNPTGSEM